MCLRSTALTGAYICPACTVGIDADNIFASSNGLPVGSIAVTN